jgi:hypothetical protein
MFEFVSTNQMLSFIITDTKCPVLLSLTDWIDSFIYYTPRKQSLGGYKGITVSVRPSMYLVSATPPKRLIGFL